jgi:isoamylase
MRNFITALFLSQGVPMLQAGDEMGRTQLGNNNGYCQDNELSWLDWNLQQEDTELLNFTRYLIRLRADHRVFRRQNFFQGRAIRGTAVRDIVWLDPNGLEMTDEQWHESFARSLAVFLSGRALNEQNGRGQIIIDSDFVILLNAHHEPMEFHMPAEPADARWILRLNTAQDTGIEPQDVELQPAAAYPLKGRALAVFEFPLPEEDGL